ncbi:MAG TPA: hypothetical protein VGN96_17405 [Roseococcus sp.]|nr:hypothetical protein [Roseococcus sp.]
MSVAMNGPEVGPQAEALALAALVRDCVTAGVERRALHLRLSGLPDALREPRHRQMIDEVLAPVMRPTRARRFELPGGDLVIVSPPPGQHLEEVHAALSRLLPDAPDGPLSATMRLPVEGARLLSVVEGAMGLVLRREPISRAETLPPPSASDLDAALRALATADLAASLRSHPIWRLGDGQSTPTPLWTETRVHLADLMERLLPGASLAGAPALGRLFRRAAERRLLADLARPQVARAMDPTCLPLSLGSVTEAEGLRFDAALGAAGRAQLVICVPLSDVLADPAGTALAARLARERGWTLGLDEVEPWHLARIDLRALGLGLVRLRFRAEWLAGSTAERAALDATLPQDRNRVVLMGADAPVAIAWAWQRGITAFMGKVLDTRR